MTRNLTAVGQRATIVLIAVLVTTAAGGIAFAPVGIASGASSTDLTVSVADGTIAPGERTTVAVAVTNADGGVGASELRIRLTDPSVASITDVSVEHSPGDTSNEIVDGGAATDVKYGFADSPDTGQVTIVTATVRADAAGSTGIELVENQNTGNLVVFDEVGAGYSLSSIGSASLSVREDNGAPTADAGSDQSVDEGTTVTLDGTGSSDPDGDSLAYTWTQTDGPSVSLQDASTATPTFTAPEVDGETTFSFDLTVSDGVDSTADATDSVSVTVQDTTTAPASFQLTNLPAPASGTVGDVVTVSAIVENTGGQAATKQVTVTTAGGVELASKSVSLAAGEEAVVTLGLSTDGLAADTYSPTIATPDDSGSFSLTLSESTDDTVTGTLSLSIAAADGTVPSSADYQLVDTVTGEILVDSQTSTGSAMTDQTFTVGRTYRVAVSADGYEDASTTFTWPDGTYEDVTVTLKSTAAPASFQLSDVPSTVSGTVGDTAAVAVTVTNTGDESATETIAVETGGKRTTSDLTLAPGETVTDYVVEIPTDTLSAGSYSSRISTPDDSVAFTLELTESTQGDRFEPNDEEATATPIEPGEDFTGLRSAAGDMDVFAVDLSAGETFESTITFDHDEKDLNLMLTDGQHGVLDDSITATDDESISATVEESGTYYLMVGGIGDTTAPYSLSTSLVTNETGGNETGGNETGSGDGVAVGLSPAASMVGIGQTTTVAVTVTGAPDGVGVFEYTLSLPDDAGATITDATYAGADATSEVDIAPDGSSVTVSSALAQLTGDEVTISTVTIEGTGATNATVDLSVASIGSPDGNPYTVATVSDGTLTVAETVGPPPVGDNDRPTNADGDSAYEDVNGDGTANILDVQTLFANLDEPAVEDHPTAYDFNGDGSVNVLDIQALFAEL